MAWDRKKKIRHHNNISACTYDFHEAVMPTVTCLILMKYSGMSVIYRIIFLTLCALSPVPLWALQSTLLQDTIQYISKQENYQWVRLFLAHLHQNTIQAHYCKVSVGNHDIMEVRNQVKALTKRHQPYLNASVVTDNWCRNFVYKAFAYHARLVDW